MYSLGRAVYGLNPPQSRRQRLALQTVRLADCTSTRLPRDVTAIAPFDAQRCPGRWCELVRPDDAFERGLTAVSANDTARAAGGARVANRGDAPASLQPREGGKTLFTGALTTATLKVSFFGPLCSGDYVVVLDLDYRWARVLGSDTSCYWILARDKYWPAEERDTGMAQARSLGVDTSSLIWVTQERQTPAY